MARTEVVKKTYNLPPELVARAKRILHARTETEAIIRSLEAVSHEDEIHRGVRKVSGKVPDFEPVR